MSFGEQKIYDEWLENERQRLERYKAAWQAYNTELADALKIKQGQPNDNVKIAKCETVVDTSVAYLFGKSITFELDQDKDKERAKDYAPDGSYIPRTVFLASDGTLDKDIHAPRPQYQYFYDEKDPASIGAGMDAALAKLAPKK